MRYLQIQHKHTEGAQHNSKTTRPSSHSTLKHANLHWHEGKLMLQVRAGLKQYLQKQMDALPNPGQILYLTLHK